MPWLSAPSLLRDLRSGLVADRSWPQLIYLVPALISCENVALSEVRAVWHRTQQLIADVKGFFDSHAFVLLPGRLNSLDNRVQLNRAHLIITPARHEAKSVTMRSSCLTVMVMVRSWCRWSRLCLNISITDGGVF